MKKIALVSLFLFGLSAFAIKTGSYFENSVLKKASCLLETKILINEKQKTGICSATLITPNLLLTAKHCGFLRPARVNPDRSNDDGVEFISIRDIKITCDGAAVTGVAFQKHPSTDIALIKISEPQETFVTPMAPYHFLNLTDNFQSKKCSAYGFGLNNSNKMRQFNGTLLKDLRLLSIADSRLMGALDYDFKGMAMYYANQMFGDLSMHSGTFPHLFNQIHRAGIEQEDLESYFLSFKTHLKNLDLNLTSSMYDAKEGPNYKSAFKAIFHPLYRKAFAPLFAETTGRLMDTGAPLFSIFINVENSTDEQSGIDSGDSGGAFACRTPDGWKVAGVNSMRMDSNLAYFPEPWEPMHSKPLSRITKNGEIVPLTYEVQRWITKTIRSRF